MTTRRVLVMGDDLRSFLSVVRSLARRGIEVHACPALTTLPALYSRHITKVHRLPPYGLDPQAWVMALKSVLDSTSFDLVIPCDDANMAFCQHHEPALAPHRIALPNPAAYSCFVDKFSTRQLAQACQVPVSEGGALSASDTQDSLAARLGLPLVIKPRKSVLIEQPHTRQTVKIAQDLPSLSAILGALHARENYIVENFFKGSGVGLSVLAKHGTVLQAFQHRRVLEAGQTSGSSYRVSEAVDPLLLTAVKAMCSVSQMHGVAMFEFRRNSKLGTFVLLEVNARFWGSLPLAVAAGVDFPSQLFDLLVHDLVQPPVQYRVGFFARNLTSDFHARLAALQDRSEPIARRLSEFTVALLQSAAQLVSGNEQWDSFDWNDTAPFRTEAADLGRVLLAGFARRLPFASAARRHSVRKSIRKARIKRRGQRLRILFLCYGNICRSPFAASIARQLLASDADRFEILSAGLLPLQGRNSPSEAIHAANRYVINLSNHSSSYADDTALERSDLIVVFDRKNIEGLRSRGFEKHPPVICLADLMPGTGEIEDPFGKGHLAFEIAYDQISTATKNLIKLVRDRQT